MNMIDQETARDGRENSEEGLASIALNRQNSNLQRMLIEMGFDIELTNKFLSYFEITSVERAIEYMVKVGNKWNHPFVITDDNNDICLVCGENSDSHIINMFRRPSVPDLRQERSDHRELRRFSSHPVVRNNKINIEEIKLDLTETCNICMGEITRSYSQCAHKFCEDCIVEYIKNKINNSDVEGIGCPEGKGKCDRMFSAEEIKVLVSQKDYERYLKFKKRTELNKIPNSAVCPIADCESYALKSGDEKVLTCLMNHHRFCIECNQLAHDGVNCDKNLENHLKQWKDMAKYIKKCPKC
jgi:hypothetical protein